MPAEGILVLDALPAQESAARLDAWTEEARPRGVLALVAEADREDGVPLLQRLCRERGLALHGAVFPALVAGGRFAPRGAVLLALPPDAAARLEGPFPADADARRAAVGRIAEDVAAGLERPHETALLLVFDAMLPDVASLLDVLYLKLADGVRYLGVNAGSETFRPIPCLFDGERAVQGGLLSVTLPGHPGAVLEHGYQVPVRTISATATEGNRVVTIDWRPAFDVYRELIREEYGVDVDRESFYRLAVHFPFGIVRADDEVLVRIPVALEPDGSLFCVGEVPPDALLTLLRAPTIDSERTVAKLATALAARAPAGPGSGLLAFYCAGRRLHLGERSAGELGALARVTGASPVAGALSLGEIGHSHQWGYPLFHNGAIVCCRWGPP